jgi:hypothetical protein
MPGWERNSSGMTWLLKGSYEEKVIDDRGNDLQLVQNLAEAEG